MAKAPAVSAVSYPAFAAPATIYPAAAQFSTTPGLALARLGQGRIPPARRRNCTLKQNFAAWVGFHGDAGSPALGHFSAAAKWRLRLPDERWVL
jgi:hypothetical protein